MDGNVAERQKGGARDEDKQIRLDRVVSPDPAIMNKGLGDQC